MRRTCEPVAHRAAHRGRELTLELDAYEVPDAQVLQEDTGGSAGLEEERDVGAQLTVERREVEVGRLCGEEGSVPEVL